MPSDPRPKIVHEAARSPTEGMCLYEMAGVDARVPSLTSSLVWCPAWLQKLAGAMMKASRIIQAKTLERMLWIRGMRSVLMAIFM